MHVAVALIVYGVLLQYHQSGALSLKAIHRRLRQSCIGRFLRQGGRRRTPGPRPRFGPGSLPTRLRRWDNITGESSSGKDQAEASVLTHKETG